MDKPITRSAVIERQDTKDNKPRIVVRFMSSAPVLEYSHQYDEYVYHSIRMDESVIDNTDHITKTPFCLDHDWTKQIGRVESVTFTPDGARAVIVLSDRHPEVKDILDGIRTNISVGFTVKESRKTGETIDGLSAVEITKLRLLEISSVAVPADESCSVEAAVRHNRSKGVKPMSDKELHKDDVAVRKDEIAKREAELEAKERELALAELKKREEALAKREAELKKREEAMKPVKIDNTVAEAPAVHTAERGYDYNRVFRALADGTTLDGLEGEIHQELSRGVRTSGIVVPVSRNLLINNTPSAAKVEDIVVLEDRLASTKFADVRYGDGHNQITVPVLDDASFAAATGAENATNSVTPTFTNVALNPQRASITLPVSDGSSLVGRAGEQLISRLQMRVALEIDKQVIAKMVAGGQVSQWTTANDPTYKEVVDARGLIRSEYPMAFALLNGKTRGYLMGDGTDFRVAFEDGRVIGDEAIISSLVADGTLIFVAPDAVLLGLWGAMTLEADRDAKAGMTHYTAAAFYDCEIAHSEGVVVKTN